MTKHVHLYEKIYDKADATVSVCKSCKKRVVFGKDHKGRVDNKRYLQENSRTFAQPYGRTGNLYRRIHGNPDPAKFGYKPKSIANAENERGWDELKNTTRGNKQLI